MSYDVNLSNGTLFATIYPLEKNGPNNRSTPRHILDANSSNDTFTLAGDVTSRFVAGFQFDVQNSAGNDGTYTVAVGGSTAVGSPVFQTVIPVTSSVLTEALPLGEIEYTVPNVLGSPSELNSSITLFGQGSMNWGENVAENLIRMLENFANDVEPELNINIGTNPAATPLIGQLWYRTLSGSEGFLYWNGSQWTTQYQFGTLVLPDLEDSNKKFYISASETNLPIPWPGGGNNQPGLVIWEESDPANNEPVFRILSSNGTELLRVEYSNTDQGWTSTVNNILIETGSAKLTLRSDALETSAITLETSGIERARLYVDDNEVNHPLNIQVGVSPNVTFNNDQTTIFRDIVSVDSTLNYETIITDDDNIPNKRYVDVNFQPIDNDLSTIAALTPTVGQSIVALGSPLVWTAYDLDITDLPSVDPLLSPTTGQFLTAQGSPPIWTTHTLILPADFIMVCTNEISTIPLGTVFTFRMPYSMTLTEVRASVSSAPVGSDLNIDIYTAGSPPISILSTKLSIDEGEKTSTTAVVPAVISDPLLIDDEEISIFVSQVGSPIGSPTLTGMGLKITFKGTKAYS